MGKIKLNRVPLRVSEGTTTLKKVLWNSKEIIPAATTITPQILKLFSDIAEYLPISVRPGPGVEDQVMQNIKCFSAEKDRKKVEDLGVEHEPGEILFSQGDSEPKDCYILLEGKLDVIVNDVTVAQIVESGKPIGEMSFISGEPRSATIRCAERTKILRLDFEKKNTLFKTHPTIIATLLDALVGRLAQTTREKVDYQQKYDSMSDLKALHKEIEHLKKIQTPLKNLVRESIGSQKGNYALAGKIQVEIRKIFGKQTKNIRGIKDADMFLEKFVEYIGSNRQIGSKVPPITDMQRMPAELKPMVENKYSKKGDT